MSLIGTGGPNSMLSPGGIQAEHIKDLFVTYLDVAAIVFVLVMGALVIALVRREKPDEPERTEPSPEALKPKKRAVGAATAMTVLTLLVLLVLSIVTSRALASLSPKDAIKIHVTGKQWWWKVTYPGEVAGTQFDTANEIHVPVGKTIELHLASADVIHSFWVPSLHGKRDLIPGKNGTFVFRADEPGRYEGQCAEFCGTQHANMKIVVVAEKEDEFRAWLEHQKAPAVTPTDPLTQSGQEVFLKSRCIACHSISGTEAYGTVGPDLTHVASRRIIAASSSVTPGHLAGWVANPQSVKPGTQMPANALAPEDLNALVAYLGSLR